MKVFITLEPDIHGRNDFITVYVNDKFICFGDDISDAEEIADNIRKALKAANVYDEIVIETV